MIVGCGGGREGAGKGAKRKAVAVERARNEEHEEMCGGLILRCEDWEVV